MKYIDEFRQSQLAKNLVEAIRRESHKPMRIMEVCGSHTVAISRAGIKALLPGHIGLVSGPGCPVCVTSAEDIERAIQLACLPDVIFTTFGDMLRVPGASGSLECVKAHKSQVVTVYSPMEALALAQATPQKQVVFYGVGFETTSPAIAATILSAARQEVGNFSVFSVHKLVPPALKALLSCPDISLDGFILPGHVSAILGSQPYEFISQDYQRPGVIAGFEAVDILEAILMLARLHEANRADIQIQYQRVVNVEGNPQARRIMAEVFEPAEADWRGLGRIPASGLKIQPQFARFDAALRFPLPEIPVKEPEGCACGEVLRGLIQPAECGLFGQVCTPENPVGPCMVSSEGSCAAFFKYSAA